MKLRVLLFEDNAATRELLELFIRKLGHEVLACSNPTEAPLPCGQSGECSCPQGWTCADLVITDNHMPKMSGLRFLSQQEAFACKSTKKSALVSGTLTLPEIAKALALGCRILHKPFRITEFRNLIEEVENTTAPQRRLRELAG